MKHTKNEALKLALEYLKQRELAWNVQIALKEALAAPVQEPVAWLIPGSITTDPELAKANGDKAVALGKISTQQWNPEDHYKDGWRDALESVKRTTPPAQPAPVQEPFVWTVSKGGAYTSGEYFVAERIDGKGWNAHKGGDTILLAESVEVCKAACERDAAAPVQPTSCWVCCGAGVEFDDTNKTTPCPNCSEAATTTPPAAQPAVPDALTSADIQEHIEYVAGWNDCRAEMLKGMK